MNFLEVIFDRLQKAANSPVLGEVRDGKIVGEGVNTGLFYGIALHNILPERMLFRGVLMGWTLKVMVEVVMLPVSYSVVRLLKRAEAVDHYDYDTNFNPFFLR